MENRKCDLFFKSCCHDGSDEKVESSKSRQGSTSNQNNSSSLKMEKEMEKEMMKEMMKESNERTYYHPDYTESVPLNRSQANVSSNGYYTSAIPHYEEQYINNTSVNSYIEREKAAVQNNEENSKNNYGAIYNQNYTSGYVTSAYNNSECIPEPAPEYPHEYTSEYKPDYTSEYKPDYTSEYKPDYTSEYKPEYTSEYKPEYTSEYKPDYTSEYKTEYKPEYTSGYATEYTPHKYQTQEQSTQQYIQHYVSTPSEKNSIIYKETKDGEIPVLSIKGDQAIFNVPVYQDKYLRDKYIEVPKYEVQDVIQPKMYTQETRHDVPTIELIYKEKALNIPKHKYLEKSVEVDVPIGYTPIYSPKWDIREVPKPVPKYEGKQKIIEVEVPQIKYVDKIVEKEIIVDVREQIIPKITEIEKPIDVVKYQWKEEYQDVPVYKYVPKIDVELDCPPPLIIPYPEAQFQNTSHIMNPDQTAADLSPEILLKNMNIHTIENAHVKESMKKSLLEIVRTITPQKSEKKEKSSWLFWKKNKSGMGTTDDITNAKEIAEKDEIDPETGYPKSMPKDFAHFFKKDLKTVKKQMNALNERRSNSGLTSLNEKTSAGAGAAAAVGLNENIKDFDKSPVMPTIEYLGKIDKPPIDGGKLDAISFKLHAIEVHQFIPVPTLPKPKFLDLVPPEKIEQNDITGLENVFGTVPEGWVDPNITGFIAPMMNDVLQGNIHPRSPLFSKISIGTSGHNTITTITNNNNNNNNNNMSKMKSLSILQQEEHNSMQKEINEDNLSCKNSITYTKQPSVVSQHQRAEEIYDSPN